MIQNKFKRWPGGVLLFSLVLLFMNAGTVLSQSSANYKIKKFVLDQGGAPSQSANYKIIEAIGQPSPVTVANSTNYSVASGYFAGGEAVQTPVLLVTPTTLDFGTTQTSLPFQISNTGSGTLTWAVSENPDKPWITSVTPASGSGNATVTVTVDRTQLAGSSDTGMLTVSSNGGNQNVTVLISKAGGQATITPDAPATAQAGQEFWVAVVVDQVSNLFGVSLDLNYPTTYVNYVQSQITNPRSGPANLLGNDLIPFDNPDDPNGKVSLGVTRKSGQGDVSGSGPVVWAKFVSLASTPDLTQVTWSCTNVTANDASGNSITLTPQTATTTIGAGCIVWPGDTNDDGNVTAADILPIGLYFGSTGTPRPGASLTWTGQSVPCWTPEKATYADANGNGSVGAEDILAIGLNWEKTHSSSLAKQSPKVIQSLTANTIKPLVTWASGDSFKVEIQVTEVTDLFGIAFDLIYSTVGTEVEVLSVVTDPFIGTDLVFFSQIDNTAKKANVGISRKAGQGGVSGTGTVASIYFQGNLTAPVGTTVNFQLQNITANDASGNAIALSAEPGSFVTEVESELELNSPVPENFALFQNYPNPFNPETTIEFSLPKETEVTIKVINLLGKDVKTLVQGKQHVGHHRIVWNGTDNHGQRLASGVYLYRMETKDFVRVRKMVFLQ